MNIKDLISDDVPPLKTTDNGKKALEWMDEFKVSHLAVTERNNYIGLLSEDVILDMNSQMEPVSVLRKKMIKPYLLDYQNAYDALSLYASSRITVIPVLDSKEKYSGVITVHQLLDYLASITSAGEPGSIVILELSDRDYSLSQIAQIVESNDAKVLSLFVSTHQDSRTMDVTIKVNMNDTSSIIQTFERYGYTIKSYFTRRQTNKNLQDRYEALMHYINL